MRDHKVQAVHTIAITQGGIVALCPDEKQQPTDTVLLAGPGGQQGGCRSVPRKAASPNEEELPEIKAKFGSLDPHSHGQPGSMEIHLHRRRMVVLRNTAVTKHELQSKAGSRFSRSKLFFAWRLLQFLAG